MSDKSWAELYEERKASRLAEEKINLEEKRGFSCSDFNMPLPESKFPQNYIKPNSVLADDSKVDDSNAVYSGSKVDHTNAVDSDSLANDTNAVSSNSEEGFPSPTVSRPILKRIDDETPKACDDSNSTPQSSAGSSEPAEEDSDVKNKFQGPPLTPDQLIAVALGNSPSGRPSRPNVPTPGKYGTTYGGAPSPGPNPSRNFNPPGYVPPTPPASRVNQGFKRNNFEDIKPLVASAKTPNHEQSKNKPRSYQESIRMAKKDASLSSSSWEEEYLAKKKARLNSGN